MDNFIDILLRNKSRLKKRLDTILSNRQEFYDCLNTLSEEEVSKIVNEIDLRLKRNKSWQREGEKVKEVLGILNYRTWESSRRFYTQFGGFDSILSDKDGFLKRLYDKSDREVFNLINDVKYGLKVNYFWQREEEKVNEVLGILNYRLGDYNRWVIKWYDDYLELKNRGDLDTSLLNSYKKKLDSYNKDERAMYGNALDVYKRFKDEINSIVDKAEKQGDLLKKEYGEFESKKGWAFTYAGLEELVRVLGDVHSKRGTTYNLINKEVDDLVIRMDKVIMDYTKNMSNVEYRPMSIAKAASDVVYHISGKNNLNNLRLSTPNVEIDVKSRLSRKQSLSERIVKGCNNMFGKLFGYKIKFEPAYAY